MLERPSEEEALKLAIAFFCILEPDRRAEVLALAEKYAREAPVVADRVHFSLLDHVRHESYPASEHPHPKKSMS
ncbi:hypothetical protein V5279_29970 [Bradyrhizobium sp. 26S5]|uniref:hypothetical protein n=1 Tax=Bradyrhizobium sp. 26S5 TaxID=3139729 RepID=UPI0030CEFCBE